MRLGATFQRSLQAVHIQKKLRILVDRHGDNFHIYIYISLDLGNAAGAREEKLALVVLPIIYTSDVVG